MDDSFLYGKTKTDNKLLRKCFVLIRWDAASVPTLKSQHQQVKDTLNRFRGIEFSR